jgi:hypothetical protein
MIGHNAPLWIVSQLVLKQRNKAFPPYPLIIIYEGSNYFSCLTLKEVFGSFSQTLTIIYFKICKYFSIEISRHLIIYLTDWLF